MQRVLIIGAGLSGICLSERLLDSGVAVRILDPSELPSSTGISTGMYNPIVFRRLNKSWMIDTLLPVMHEFYHGLEEKLSVTLTRPIEFFKRIPNADYESWWNDRLHDPVFQSYMGSIESGLGPVLRAGMINCALLKSAYRAHAVEVGVMEDAAIDYANLKMHDTHVEYEGHEYDAVVFCEGAFATQNPFFNWLPFNICKGEWVIIRCEEDLGERVINNVVNIIPLGDKHYKLSSTYSWKDLDWTTTEQAKTTLLQAFEQLHDCPYEVIEQQAGLRPTVADRRPYLGSHPDRKRLFIFNGLGSKGIMLAPYFSKHLAEHMLEGKALLPEVDIARHIKRYRSLAP